MTILLHTFAAKNVFRNQSVSVIANFSPGRMSSKCASFDSVLPLVQRTSSCLWIRSFCSNQTEDQVPNSLTPEEKAWKNRVTEVTIRLESYHDLSRRATLDLMSGKRIFHSMEKEKSVYRKRWAIYRLISKIEDIGKRLIDENVDDICQLFYIIDRFEKWMLHGDGSSNLEVVNYDQCWQSLLKSSEHPLAHKLREKLLEAEITLETFSKSVSKVYIELQRQLFYFNFCWSMEVINFGVDDIKEVLNNLPISSTDYECIKILFNLEESEKWQIKDSTSS